jgi:geranylgeranyl transferase type-2 subunit beta
LTRQANLIDLFSLLYSAFLIELAGERVLGESAPDWRERVLETLASYRTDDGGYAKAAGSSAGSTYHTFLVCLCHELLGEPVPESERLQAFIGSRQRADGGFVEIAAMRHSGTNPTAAAVGCLRMLPGGIAEEECRRVGAFVAAQQSSEGGFKGNSRAPAADLLSSFTGAWTLGELGMLGAIDVTQLKRYAQALQMPDGGFRGGLWDSGRDVEYTFYGLGCLALSEPGLF